MVKCGACGKYLSSSECVKCSKCPLAFHRACVSLPASTSVSATWLCPGCKVKVPREDNSSTPVKGIVAAAECSADLQVDPASTSTTQGTASLIHSAAGTTKGTASNAQGTASLTHGAAGIAKGTASTTQSTAKRTQSDAASAEIKSTTQVKDELAIEIRAFREELSAARTELREMRTELAGFRASIQSCNDRIEVVEDRLSILEHKFEEKVPYDVDALEATITTLKQELDIRDQELLLNDIDIAGVPESPDDHLVHLVKVLALKVGSKVEDEDIVHAERVGPINRNIREKDGTGAVVPPRPRNIVVRLARRITRDQLIGAARVRRGITSTDLELQGAPRRIYVNERLTRTNRQLFARAREAARRSHYKYVWTRDGKIFARKEDGRTAERVRSEKDLSKIFGPSSV